MRYAIVIVIKVITIMMKITMTLTNYDYINDIDNHTCESNYDTIITVMIIVMIVTLTITLIIINKKNDQYIKR